MKFLRFIIAIIVFAIMSTLCAKAADYNLAVGESCTVQVDDGIGYKYIGIESVTCTNPSVYVVKQGLSVKATVNAYFSGTATVTSTVRYQLYPSQPYQYRYHRFTIACKGNGSGTGGGTTEHGFRLDRNSITVNQGEMSSGINVTWSEISNCNCYWSIDDQEVAMVDNNYSAHCYVIGGEKPGTTYLRAKNAQGYTQTVKVTVTPKTYNVGDSFFGLTSDTDKSYLICKVLNTENKTCNVSLGANPFPNITIPSKVMGYTVVAIADNGFANKTIESLKLPGEIKRIGSWAFYQTKGLKEFVISKNIDQIDSYAFERCEMSKITMHTSFDPLVIGSEIFKDCKDLKEIRISRLKKIPFRTFINCESLQKVIFGAPMINIDEEAFVNCPLLREIRLPRTMSEFRNGTFFKFDIKDVYVKYANPPASGSSINNFLKCKNATLHVPIGCKENYLNNPDWKGFSSIIENELTETYTHGNKTYSRDNDDYTLSVLKITGYEDTDLRIGKIDTNNIPIFCLEDYSLSDNKFNSVSLPSTLVYIGENAFTNSQIISEIVIPKDVDYIASTAFNDCPNLSDFSTEDGNQIFISAGGVLQSRFIPGKIFRVPCAKAGKISLRKGIYLIKKHAFGNCKNISEVSFPATLRTIEPYAFYGCESLKTLTLPNGVVNIGKNAFTSMNLESLHVNWETPIEIDGESFDSDIYASTILFVPNGTKQTYKNSFPWNLFHKIKEERESVSEDEEIKTVLYEGLNEDDKTCDWSFETFDLDEDYNNLGPSDKEVWKWEAYNGKHYLVGNAHEFAAPFSVNSFAFSPAIDVKGLKKFRISFDHAAKYQESGLFDLANVRLYYVDRTDKEDDGLLCIGEIPELPTPGSWTFVHSGEIEMELDERRSDVERVRICLYYHGDSADGANAWEIKNIKMIGIGSASGIDNVLVEPSEANSPVEVYNLSGIKISESTDHLPSGIYIIRKGSTVDKISIK